MPKSAILLGLLAVFLLGIQSALMIVMFLRMESQTREIRVLGIQVQDQSAILLREGISKPRDTTVGPTYVGPEMQGNHLPGSAASGAERASQAVGHGRDE